jgi:ABC-type transport system involved in cytochrome bd biosynthesis fused ATPase/permease subunit
VLLARLRLFGAVRVVQSLYAVLVVYLLLVAYELLILSSYFISRNSVRGLRSGARRWFFNSGAFG